MSTLHPDQGRALGPTLITGGAGFIGSTLVHALATDHPEVPVVNVDSLTYAGDLRNLEDVPTGAPHHFVRADVCDTEAMTALVREHNIRTVVHLAAESHVDRSITEPAAFLRTNVLGTASVLQAAQVVWSELPAEQRSRCRWHQVSTDEVYGDLPAEAPPSEVGDAYRPSSPYAASKAAADHMVWAWARTYGLPVSVSQCTNNMGPRQYPEKLVPVLVRQALAGAPIGLYGDGLQERDWIDVRDHVRGLLTILRAPQAAGHAWHLGADQPATNLWLAQQVCALLDAERPEGAPHAQWIRFVKDRPGHDRRYALAWHARANSLGGNPEWTFAPPWHARCSGFCGTRNG